MTLTPEQALALRKPFPPESIGKLPKGGAMLDYVGHAAVTDRLLTVDPEWTWEPLALGPDGLPAVDREGNLWIKLTICGVTRLGVGDGKSAKERIGDAIRNAGMRFGVALDLWAKEDLVEFAQAAVAHRQTRVTAHPIESPELVRGAERPASMADLIAADGRDWHADADALDDVDALRGLYREAQHAGDTDAAAYIAARAALLAEGVTA